jgi:hypothetical protein
MGKDPLLLVTHDGSDEIFANGILSGKIPEAVKNFPGTTAHISMREDTPHVSKSSCQPYGGEDIYDINLVDKYHGTITEEQAEAFLEYEPITRAGTQYRNCAANTDATLSAVAEREIELNYFTDLTIALDKSDTPRLLENEKDYKRRESINIKNNLDIRYGSFGI